MINKKIAILTMLIAIFSSCISPKRVIYFQNDEIDQNLVNNDYKTIFKADDLLQIIVTSKDLESAIPFNLPVITTESVTNSPVGQPVFQTYLVDSNGEIDFPVLGKIKVANLTREELISNLKNKLSPNYIKKPTINIMITNFKVTVLGDVKRPGTYNIKNERLTILEALGLAGDLELTGDRKILVTREENGEKKIYEVDLLSKKIYNSPVYYLQQNDLIYVKPNYAKSQYAVFNPNTGLFVSIASIFIALVSIIVK
ncbi:polysaccharide biosynthesis/export family protein [Polaribacter aquimarinus]|uniref:Sugar transporter n=1 Tax=Polaribacter aquimarinus TaxID=2100726 RepID=A0A2U2JAW1_9FLAO|nr:polysaccharide biosynthesis/export family protein [Polaribacter aquimarinus]PWG05470.1 sugar transporter [Polaribacter aquimarinus]